jgi:excisionase family DNA binding protein
MTNDDIMNRKEAARYLKVSTSTLDRLVKDRKIPFSKINGRILFLKKDLLKWVESKRIK